MEVCDISRSAAGSGARISLPVLWQVEHLALNTAAPSMAGGVCRCEREQLDNASAAATQAMVAK